ncbi:hypothetical protein [Actinomadura sp. 7K507]|uniref:hypothetical protein n=1 Tax=Actinomadura sp. 7K507 TaxID=2530365 RepID=UPI0010430AA2|nr:hypothetical protein [Actinomadura sp. 7K507]TDC72929.1 hypothetical protein E1285_44950 [Actinomadura sp. 7K507]
MSERLDQVFGQLVTRSWQRFDEETRTREIDDILVGAVITASVAQGNALIDLTSDGNHHYLRFQHLQNKHRLMFQLTHRTGTITSAKTMGQHAAVTMAYGEYVQDARTVWQALKSEVKSGFLDVGEPGVFTVDADLGTGYVYVQVPLLLDLDHYFADHYTVKYPVLQEHIAAVAQACAKYLHGRIAA